MPDHPHIPPEAVEAAHNAYFEAEAQGFEAGMNAALQAALPAIEADLRAKYEGEIEQLKGRLAVYEGGFVKAEEKRASAEVEVEELRKALERCPRPGGSDG